MPHNKSITYIHLIFLLLLFALSTFAVGQEENSAKADSVMAWDQSTVDVRLPSADVIEAYKSDPQYEYDRVKRPEPWWKAVLRWLRNKITIGEGSWSALGWSMIFLASLTLIFFILKIIGVPVKGLFIFSRSTHISDLSFSANNLNIDDEKLDKKLQTFIDAEAYREATRILFILLLKQLNKSQLIKWSSWKTDREYYYELKDEALKSTFLQLIKHYEFIWYGQFNIHQEQFSKVQLQFESFTKEIKTLNGKR